MSVTGSGGFNGNNVTGGSGLPGDLVFGPGPNAGSSTVGNIVIWDNTTGTLIADSGISIGSASGSSIDYKQPARAASTANIVSLSGLLTIDGVLLVDGDRVLVKNQTTAADNGIYVVAAGAWTRATDTDSDSDVNAAFVIFIEEGTVNADTGWILTSNNPITLGTTPLSFMNFTNGSSGSEVTAGTVTLTGTAWTTLSSLTRGSLVITIIGQTDGNPIAVFSANKATSTTTALINRISGGPGSTTGELLELRWLASSSLEIRKDGAAHDGSYDFKIL